MSSTLTEPKSAAARQQARADGTEPYQAGRDNEETASPFADRWEMPAWALSLVVHLVILLILGSITRITREEPQIPISSAMEELDPTEYKFEATVVDQMGNDSQVNTMTASQSAARHVGQNRQQEMQEQLEQENLEIQQPVTNDIPEPRRDELVKQIETTGSTEHPGGVDGAMDRLTFEIAGSLKDRKTLVIWLFDASLSLKKRRDAIADRFQNVYKQLGQLDVGKERALKTAVASYGKSTRILTPEPVDNVKPVVKKIRNIQPDETGKEHVFSAVQTVANKWRSYRTKMRRNVMIITVTDERGDDFHIMEDVIGQLRRYGIRVYCVGNAAVFGREKGHVTFTDENGYVWRDLEVDQGPETVVPQRLKLAFWGTSSKDLRDMSSSFGPYAMTRLCAETGGLYLITAESRGPNFDPAVMRNYQPDYRPISEYKESMQSNRAKMALVQAARATRAERIPTPRLRFRADNDNILRQQITEAQKPLAVLDYKIGQMYNILKAGAKDRSKLESPRWRASFDLAYGRVMAMRVRGYGYNAVLAQMKAEPKNFQKKKSNMWRLVPSQKITAGPAVRKLAKKAREHLSRVIDKHPGTPWAMLAERELSQPMGWQWKEDYKSLQNNEPGSPAEQKARLLLAEEEKKKKQMKKKPGPNRKKPKL